MGPTKVFKTIYEEPNSIRALYGITDTRNATHGSDSVENSKQEIKFFFPDFDYELWFKNQHDIFLSSNNQILFNKDLVVHKINN
jgi:nucleoside-diphosphate kinase